MKNKRKKIIIAGVVSGGLAVTAIGLGLGLGLGLKSRDNKDKTIVLKIEGLVDAKSGKTGSFNTTNGQELTLKLVVPSGKKIESLLVDGIDKKSEIVNNTYTFTQENIKEIKAVYTDLTFNVSTTNNLILLNDNIDLGSVKYGQKLEFSISNDENLSIESLLINSLESKDLIKNNRFSVVIEANTEINLILSNSQKQNTSEKETVEDNNVSNTTPDSANTGEQIDSEKNEHEEKETIKDNNESNTSSDSNNTGEQLDSNNNEQEEKEIESYIKLVGFERDNITTHVGKEVVTKLVLPKNSTLTSLMLDGVENIDNVVNNTFTFNATKQAHELIAVYEENKYSLTLGANLSVNDIADTNKISFGQNVSVNINVPEGKEIKALIVNGSNRKRFVKNNVYSFLMRNNTEISVEFKDLVKAKSTYSIDLGDNLYISDSVDKNHFTEGDQALIFIDVPTNKRVTNVKLNGNVIDVDTSKGVFKYPITQNSTFSVEFEHLQQTNTIYVMGDRKIVSPNGTDSFRQTQKDNYLLFKINIPEGQEVSQISANNSPIDPDDIVMDGNFASIKINTQLSYFSLQVSFKEKVIIPADKKELEKTIRLAEQKRDSVTYRNEENQTYKSEFIAALEQAKNIWNSNESTQQQIDDAREDLSQKMDNLSGVYSIKSVEFKNITARELLLVNPDGTTKKVASLSANNIDPNNFLVKIVDDNFENLIPVKSIEKVGDKYKITLNQDNLVSFNSQNDVAETYSFFVDEISEQANVYTDFNTLIAAIKQNPSGTFLIGSDLFANPIEAEQYIDIDFSGTLRSVDDKNYSINNLNKPLFNKVTNSSISNFKILNSNVVLNRDGGILAKTIQNSDITKLFIEGNVTFVQNSIDSSSVGGLSSVLIDSSVTNSVLKVDLNITSDDKNGQYFALLAAKATSPNALDKKIERNYISGRINVNNNTQFQNTKLAQIIGIINNAEASSNIVDAKNQNIDLFAQISRSETSDNKIISEQNSDTTITLENAKRLLRSWGIDLEPLANDDFDTVDYSMLPDYDSSRQVAYENIAKLMSNFDRNTIVKYGNLVSTSDLLFSKKIYSLMPMHGDQFVSNLYDKDSINRLFVKFDDGTSTTYNLATPTRFEQSDYYEYRLGADLIYSPNQHLNLNDQLVNDIVAGLSGLDIHANDFIQQVKLDEYNNKNKEKFNTSTEETMKALYLDSSFAEIKSQLSDVVKSLLANYQNSDYNNEQIAKVIKKKILDNKVKIMLGLAYINRLFNINFGEFNIRKIMLFNPNFYNNSIKNIDFLIEIGSLNFEELLISNNFKTFNKYFSKLTNKNLFEFLEYNVKLFMNSTNMDEWFKSSTKAFVHEEKMLSYPDVDVSVYNRIKNKATANSYILPLLNLSENNVYIISTLGTLFFGGYGRSIDEQLLINNKAEYENKKAEVNQLIIDKSIKYRKFMELMYKIANPEGKQHLVNSTAEIFDGYLIVSSVDGTPEPRFGGQKRRWAERFDTRYTPVNDFFGPINKWHPQSPLKDSAYANQNTKVIRFDSADVLDIEGMATLTHELTHAYDHKTWLQGHEYRKGIGPEAFALGLFESITSNSSPNYGFNFVLDLKGPVTSNNSIDRFNSKQDFQEYLKGLFDVTYLLDALEAEVILSKPVEKQALFFNQLTLHKDDSTMKNHHELYGPEDINQGYTHGSDRVVQLDANSIKAMNLTDVNDLIDNNIISKLETYGLKPGTSDYLRNNNDNYYNISLFRPIFAAYSNDTGATGGLIFRRNVFELLAEFGWDNGFVNYATDALASQLSPNELLSEDFVLSKIFNGEYKNYNEFKKAMFKRRLDKKDTIRPVTIRYNNQNYTITSSEDIKNLFNIAIDKDISKLALNNRNSFQSYELKRTIIQAYNALTKNFRESIFK
ncbi:ZmpA/ZmpB/ZmpC family metallo-endopeptidase [Mycoplasma sp. HS2188]|uniref:ZmpA/ZmpB/ZmpC family metallo-endopeptidase n=1 Tax=Mycoplasma sp. HS2188 TaxID=2976765 RepID=UPI0021A9DA52|nr:ZmpA/ZmpB/ZmpC family metallo-endopeptidase [Mycoplasma sp. HS2188]MCT4469850.1 hypothetical protein [Mycoplasma sp. HS2188]